MLFVKTVLISFEIVFNPKISIKNHKVYCCKEFRCIQIRLAALQKYLFYFQKFVKHEAFRIYLILFQKLNKLYNRYVDLYK